MLLTMASIVIAVIVDKSSLQLSNWSDIVWPIFFAAGICISCNTDDTSFVYDTTVSVRRLRYVIQIIDR